MKNVKNVVCRELSHASAFYNLVERSPVWEFDPEQPRGQWDRGHLTLKVLGRIGAEGWSSLVVAIKKFHKLETNPSLTGTNPSLNLRAFKHVLQEANQEDLRTIWDWNSLLLVISRRHGPVQMATDDYGRKREKNEQDWERLLQMLHPNEDQL